MIFELTAESVLLENTGADNWPVISAERHLRVTGGGMEAIEHLAAMRVGAPESSVRVRCAMAAYCVP